MNSNSGVAHEDWFSQGKEDAWFGRSKCPPEQDPEAASLYDLGYSEGTIERSHKNPQGVSTVNSGVQKTAIF